MTSTGPNRTEGTSDDVSVVGPGDESAPTTPRWVTVLAVVLVVLVVGMFVFLHLSGAVGPGAH